MRYLLGLLVVLLIAWRWRTARSAKQVARQRATPAPQVLMAVCAHCGVHLPAHEAIAGTRGSYCSSAHRQLAEP